MQKTLSRIWTQVANFISYNDNQFTKCFSSSGSVQDHTFGTLIEAQTHYNHLVIVSFLGYQIWKDIT